MPRYKTPSLAVDCDFPGGNVIVDAIDGDTAVVRPDLRDTLREWFYWYFRVRGGSGRAVTVRFTRPAIGLRGPGMSLDAGQTWQWLGADSVDDQTFTYEFPADVDEVRFSFGMPYTQEDLQRFLERFRGNSHLEVGELCVSEQGRSVELLRFGRLDGDAKYRIMFTARHHCCEMMASYVLEGLIEAVVVDAPAQRLAESVEFVAVPFVDKDGVEEGDQGKYRAPHDHNRDYGDHESMYASVLGIRQLIQGQLNGNLDMAFDLHCPGRTGQGLYFVGSPDQANWRRVEKFSDVLEKAQQGPLLHHRSANLPHGTGWNVEDNYEATDGSRRRLMSFNGYLDTVSDVRVHAGVEIPYADAHGREVNPVTARAFGRDLARAMDVFLTTT